MTYGEARDEALKLLDKYSVAGDTVALTYNNQADYISRIPGLVNDAMTYIATTAKRIPAMLPIDREDCEMVGGMYEFQLPSDLFQFSSKGLLCTENGQTRRFQGYTAIGNTAILFPMTLTGDLILEYYRYPTLVSLSSPKESMLLDCDAECQAAIPYYVAAHLVIQEDSFLYSSLYNTFETKLGRIAEGIRAEIHAIEDVYDQGSDYTCV